MCINFNGYHSGGSSFLNVNDCWLLQKNYLYTIDKVSSEKKKKKIYIYIYIYNEESQYMVSHPETGSDSPIGSDQDRGRDRSAFTLTESIQVFSHVLFSIIFFFFLFLFF